MVLSTQSLLIALGIGSSTNAASTSVMAGAINWILKDGIGQLGGVLFASKLSSVRELDVNPKLWRMTSALALDGATLLECIAPLYPGSFLVLASVANLGKNVSFLTASASRATMHQALCRSNAGAGTSRTVEEEDGKKMEVASSSSSLANNLGDVTAKAGSQGIAASLLGTGFGIAISPLLDIGSASCEYSYVIGTCLGLGVIHQVATYQSLKVVPLTSLNRHRLHLLLRAWFQDFGKEMQQEGALTPEVVAQQECFLPLRRPDDSHTWLDIGCTVADLAPEGAAEFQTLVQDCLGGNENYVLNCNAILATKLLDDGTSNSFMQIQDIQLRSVQLVFMDNAKDVDILRGLFHAYTIQAMNNGSIPFSSLPAIQDEELLSPGQSLVAVSHAFVEEHSDMFVSTLKKYGWTIGDDCIVIDSASCRRLRIETLE
jgi:hypothetical protein